MVPSKRVFILVLLDRGLLVGRVALDCALVLADCTPSVGEADDPNKNC